MAQAKIAGLFRRPHDMRLVRVSVFMPFVSNEFQTVSKCAYCGLREEEHFVSWERLMRAGFTSAQLESIRTGEAWRFKK